MLETSPPLANPEDLQIPKCVDTADDAIAMVDGLHARWRQARPGVPEE
jgi:hypothetical protein